MNQLERDLREALRRRDAPAGFAEKVIRSAEASAAQKPWRAWLSMAAAALLMVGAVLGTNHLYRQTEGVRAKQELMVGLRITGTKLRDVQERLNTTLQPRSPQPQSEKQ
jgi:hypothetical protein